MLLGGEEIGRALPRGELRDVSPKLCPTNLPFIDPDNPDESTTSSDGGGAPPSPGAAVTFDEEHVGLAHGAAFVGRHLEMHALIESTLTNQMTAVYGAKGLGKSAMVLEVARYLRHRNRFPHGIFCCSLEGVKTMKKVLHRLGASLNLHARSASDLCKQMSRYQSCLLILDRCEAAVSQSRLQFCWLLSQLLTQARVKVLLSSQQPLKGFPEPDAEGEPSLSFGVVSLEPMIPKDAALLLLENCEREPAELLEELGNNDGNTSVLEALTAHPLLRELGGIPVVVRWAAAKLGETSVRRLHAEVRALLASSGRNKLVQIAHQAAAAASVGEVTPPVAAATASGGPTPPRERPSRSPRLARHHSSRMSAANAEAEAAAAARLAAASASASGQRDLSEWRGGDAHLAQPQPSAQLATAMAKLKACMAEVASAAAAEVVNPTLALDAAASDAARTAVRVAAASPTAVGRPAPHVRRAASGHRGGRRKESWGDQLWELGADQDLARSPPEDVYF